MQGWSPTGACSLGCWLGWTVVITYEPGGIRTVGRPLARPGRAWLFHSVTATVASSHFFSFFAPTSSRSPSLASILLLRQHNNLCKSSHLPSLPLCLSLSLPPSTDRSISAPPQGPATRFCGAPRCCVPGSHASRCLTIDHGDRGATNNGCWPAGNDTQTSHSSRHLSDPHTPSTALRVRAPPSGLQLAAFRL